MLQLGIHSAFDAMRDAAFPAFRLARIGLPAQAAHRTPPVAADAVRRARYA